MPELVTTERESDIVTITMRRPEARNALSVELISALNDAIGSVEGDDNARAMILAGEGKCFCAGMDLKGVLADARAMAGMLRDLSIASRRIRRLNIPTIAKVQGAAVGGGCGLMVVTDFAFSHAEAKVGYPEVSLGVCPAVVAPWLIRKIGAGSARSMLLAGGTMSGTVGFDKGLISHLVERSELDQAVMTFATELTGGGQTAMEVTKAWLNELDGSLEDASLDKAAQLSAEVIAGEEAQSRLRPLFGA